VRLGVMVTTDLHLPQLLGIAGAALARGHEVEVFATDAGVRLVAAPELAGLAGRPGATVSFCEQSAARLGVPTGGLPAAIRGGGQYRNSLMAEGADRLIVL